MTFKDFVKNYCVERGMFPSQADAVVGLVVADPASKSMAGRWDHDVEGYPAEMRAVIALAANRSALTWIDANLPMAWYRPMFEMGYGASSSCPVQDSEGAASARTL